ncbi:MAG: hypothetical protein CL402_09040 [Acidiferrobacteraceae bacterium]|nr:hypothetical protein [Acidiferrobacteraceae bacterium]
MSTENAKLLWRCRRGARELDALLVPYGVVRLPMMDKDEKQQFENLLQEQDSDLLDWFLGRSTPYNTTLVSTIKNILHFKENNGSRC